MRAIEFTLPGGFNCTLKTIKISVQSITGSPAALEVDLYSSGPGTKLHDYGAKSGISAGQTLLHAGIRVHAARRHHLRRRSLLAGQCCRQHLRYPRSSGTTAKTAVGGRAGPLPTQENTDTVRGDWQNETTASLQIGLYAPAGGCVTVATATPHAAADEHADADDHPHAAAADRRRQRRRDGAGVARRAAGAPQPQSRPAGRPAGRGDRGRLGFGGRHGVGVCGVCARRDVRANVCGAPAGVRTGGWCGDGFRRIARW